MNKITISILALITASAALSAQDKPNPQKVIETIKLFDTNSDQKLSEQEIVEGHRILAHIAHSGVIIETKTRATKNTLKNQGTTSSLYISIILIAITALTGYILIVKL